MIHVFGIIKYEICNEVVRTMDITRKSRRISQLIGMRELFRGSTQLMRSSFVVDGLAIRKQSAQIRRVHTHTQLFDKRFGKLVGTLSRASVAGDGDVDARARASFQYHVDGNN